MFEMHSYIQCSAQPTMAVSLLVSAVYLVYIIYFSQLELNEAFKLQKTFGWPLYVVAVLLEASCRKEDEARRRGKERMREKAKGMMWIIKSV